MTRVLFAPDSYTLLWLDEESSVDALLRAIESGAWTPPAPYDAIPPRKLNATYQDEIIIITVRSPKARSAPEIQLYRRQEEVLKRVVEGMTTREIAGQLHISPRTTQNYIAELKQIFKAQSRAELIACGMRHFNQNR